MCGRLASAPGSGPRVSALRPSVDQWAPVATMTTSAPAARTAAASRARPVSTVPFAQPPPLGVPGQPRHPAGEPAELRGRVDEPHVGVAPLAEHDRALHAAD